MQATWSSITVCMVQLTKVLIWGLDTWCEALPVTWNYCYSIFTSCNINLDTWRNTKLPRGVDKYLRIVPFTTIIPTHMQHVNSTWPLNECAFLNPVGRQTFLVLRSVPLVSRFGSMSWVYLCVQNCVFASGVQSVPIHEFFHVIGSYSRKAIRGFFTFMVFLLTLPNMDRFAL